MGVPARKTGETLSLSWLFAINNIATTAWVFAWISEMLLVSVLLMLIQLVTLALINVRLHIYERSKSLTSKIFTQFPLSIYFAWICIASTVNISSALLGMGWTGDPLTAGNWTIILFILTVLIAAFVILRLRNVFFGLVVVWALYRIQSKLKQDALNEDGLLISVSWAAMSIVLLIVLIQIFLNNSSSGQFNQTRLQGNT